MLQKVLYKRTGKAQADRGEANSARGATTDEGRKKGETEDREEDDPRRATTTKQQEDERQLMRFMVHGDTRNVAGRSRRNTRR
jgi:hypothetical protein